MYHLRRIPALIAIISLFVTCTRREVTALSQPIDVKSVQEWLHLHGGIYAGETLSVQNANMLSMGKLNWQQTKQYRWEGLNYIDIPFEFHNSKFLPRKADIAPASFVLVVRKTGDGMYEQGMACMKVRYVQK